MTPALTAKVTGETWSIRLRQVRGIESFLSLIGLFKTVTLPRYIKVILTGATVVVVIAALVIIPFDILELHHSTSTVLPPPPSSTHIGLVTNSQVNNSSGQDLNEKPGAFSLFSAQSTQKPVNADIAYFVNSIGNSRVIIGSFEFTSKSSASLFVSQTYHSAILDLEGYEVGPGGLTVDVVNDSFDGFLFTAITLGTFGNNTGSGSIVLIVAGSSNHFAFAIEVYHLAISEPIVLIHDEILAMTN